MRVKFITLGCKVNQYETQALMEEFQREGFEVTSQEADIYVVNTCTVTHRADRKSEKALLKAKREKPCAKLVALGCFAHPENRERLKRLGADYIVPQEKKPHLVDIILGRKNSSKSIWSFKITSFFNRRAFLKIQDGCDNFCSFCKIPYLRGAPLSRPKDDILNEAETLSLKHPEIVLCGTNIALYGKDLSFKENLTSLSKDILKIKNLRRMRFSSLEPLGLDSEFFSLFENEKVCPHLHLPFQSGDDRILKLMNKKETVAFYLDAVERVRKINPLLAISCDIMIGFPSEDDDSFSRTLDFLKKVRPMRMHIFRFSPREFTIFKESEVRDEKKIKLRYRVLKDMAEEFSYQYKKQFLHRTLYMVTEERRCGLTSGYTENYIRVFIEERLPLGEIVKIRVTKVDKEKVYGELTK
ncbi:MAG: MiaB/RimO family radical SAM methylthiotransferase [Candidatus Omnitrophica bacterium]|nr:MiaB/RimO family radical SAM methylthiotransferase [Candidatus Omnitrophota bacterium]